MLSGAASWLGSAISQFRNSLLLISHWPTCVYGIHATPSRGCILYLLPQFVLFSSTGACTVLHRWHFFLKSHPQRHILHPTNVHGPWGFSSVHQLLTILQHFITCEMLNLSVHVLQETDLQGTRLTLDSDSSHCSLPMSIAMFSMTLGLVWFCLVSFSSLLKS